MEGPRDRLPTLFEVLNRMTGPPVDLWSFYKFMRDDYHGVKYLDFWLDVASFLSLCRHYVKALDAAGAEPLLAAAHPSGPTNPRTIGSQHTYRRSYGHSGVHSGTPDSSLLFDLLHERFDDSDEVKDDTSARRLSAHSMDSNYPAPDEPLNYPQAAQAHYIQRSRSQSQDSSLPETEDRLYATGQVGQDYARLQGGTPPPNSSQSLHSSPLGFPVLHTHMPSIGGTERIDLENIRSSVKRIVLTYLTPGSSREIVLPGGMAAYIRQESLSSGKDNPALFDEARDYVFDALERDAYPAFLSRQALSNIQYSSSVVRLFSGLVALFGAFWLSFVFILLDWQPRAQRCWIILPFGVGWYLVFSSLYKLDPLLGLVGVSETSLFWYAKIEDVYIRNLIMKRSLFVMAITATVTACFVVVFVFVPGYRL